MEDNDRLYRFVIDNSPVRGEVVHLNATWQAVLERGNYPANVRKPLGEALAACALLAATIKFDGSLILQIRGDGPLHLLVVQATSEGTLRGLARWHDEVPTSGLRNIFGQGQMVITVEQANGEPYQGIIPLEGDSLKQAIEYYFYQSEQLETRLWLSASENTCSGLLVQLLPEVKQDDDTWQRVQMLADTITRDELLELDAASLLYRLFNEEQVRLFDPEPRCFRCQCSRDRIQSILLSLGADEVFSILQEQGIVETHCDFCNAHYSFDKVDVEQMFAAHHPPDVPDTRH